MTLTSEWPFDLEISSQGLAFFMVSWYILWNSNKSWGKEYVLQINLDLYFWFSGSSFVHESGSRSCDPKSTPHTRSAAVNSNSAVIVGMILSQC